jgi:PleD family two-component response regulator
LSSDTIARKFAYLLDGEIHVTSTKGEGSIFTLFLPLVAAVEKRAVSVPPPPVLETASKSGRAMPRANIRSFILDDRDAIDANDKVLLIVEDDPTFAATLMKIARKRGYKCLAAGDGKSGLVLAAEQQVTAIILDLRLPDIDGMRVSAHTTCRNRCA